MVVRKLRRIKLTIPPLPHPRRTGYQKKMKKRSGKKILKRRAGKRRTSVSAECSKEVAVYKKKVIEKSPEAYERLTTAVMKNFLFCDLEDDQRKEVLDAMSERDVKVGEVMIKQGDPGDFFYVVDTGLFDVFVKDVNDGKSVLQYKNGGSFGELALMYNAPRAATVTCVEDGHLFILDRVTFRHILNQTGEQRRNRYTEMLKKIKMLNSLTQSELAQIADVLEVQKFAKDELIIKKDDDNFDSFKFYLVLSGTALASIHPPGEDKVVVGKMETGAYFGEKAFLESGRKRACDVYADSEGEDLSCACMDVVAFERLMGPLKDTMIRNISKYKTIEEARRESNDPTIN